MPDNPPLPFVPDVLSRHPAVVSAAAAATGLIRRISIEPHRPAVRRRELALAAGLPNFHAARCHIFREKGRGSVPTVVIVWIACIGVTAAGGVLGVTVDEPWQMPDLSVWPLLFGSALCLIVGYWLVIFAMRTGDAGASAPFRYTVIVWATLYGFLIWGDRPDLWTGIGTVLIVAPSLYVFYRERRLAREDPANSRE